MHVARNIAAMHIARNIAGKSRRRRKQRERNIAATHVARNIDPAILRAISNCATAQYYVMLPSILRGVARNIAWYARDGAF